MKNHEEFRNGMQLLGAAFAFEITDAVLRSYWFALHDEVSDEDFAKTIKHFMKRGKFMPKPSEIAELCEGNYGGGERAWEYALKAARNRRISYRFEDPLIAVCIERMGGLRAMALRNAEDLQKWGRKEFLETYASLSKVPPKEVPTHVKGQEEIDSGKNWWLDERWKKQIHLLGPKEDERRVKLLAGKTDDNHGEGLSPDDVDWGGDTDEARKAFWGNVDKIGRPSEERAADAKKKHTESIFKDGEPLPYPMAPESFKRAFRRAERRHEKPYSIFDMNGHPDDERRGIELWLSRSNIAWFKNGDDKIRVEWKM